MQCREEARARGLPFMFFNLMHTSKSSMLLSELFVSKMMRFHWKDVLNLVQLHFVI